LFLSFNFLLSSILFVIVVHISFSLTAIFFSFSLLILGFFSIKKRDVDDERLLQFGSLELLPFAFFTARALIGAPCVPKSLNFILVPLLGFSSSVFLLMALMIDSLGERLSVEAVNILLGVFLLPFINLKV